jgi:hypothetical protein
MWKKRNRLYFTVPHTSSGTPQGLLKDSTKNPADFSESLQKVLRKSLDSSGTPEGLCED